MRAVKGLLYVVDKVVGVFKTARESDKVGRNACGVKFFIGQLTVRGTCRMQTAAASIRNVRLDCNDFEPFHKLFSFGSSALNAETHDAASAVRAIFLCKRIVRVTFESGIFNPRDTRIGL